MNPTIRLDFSLYVYCPHCKAHFDIADSGYVYERDEITTAVFNNRWGDVKGMEVTCPSCEKEFTVDGIEY